MSETTFENVPAVKQPKTFEEQVSIIKSRGFIVDDDAACIAFLKKANYYRLSAFFLPFKKKDGAIRKGVNFRQVARIYEFDGKLRAVLFQSIEGIEFFLRTQLSYFSGHHHGALGYLDSNNFSNKHDEQNFSNLLNSCIEENKRTLVVRHHKAKYNGQFPIWVIIEFFSMGMLSRFYADLKTDEQKSLAKEMYGTNPACLRSWLRCVTDLRNRCAHYSRVYGWTFSAVPKMPRDHAYVSDHGLFSQILMLMFLYPDAKTWNSNLLVSIEALIEEYSNDISLSYMGFPDNWVALLSKTV